MSRAAVSVGREARRLSDAHAETILVTVAVSDPSEGFPKVGTYPSSVCRQAVGAVRHFAGGVSRKVRDPRTVNPLCHAVEHGGCPQRCQGLASARPEPVELASQFEDQRQATLASVSTCGMSIGKLGSGSVTPIAS